MKEKNNIISDWLDKHGDPEIDKKVEERLKGMSLTPDLKEKIDVYFNAVTGEYFRNEFEKEKQIRDDYEHYAKRRDKRIKDENFFLRVVFIILVTGLVAAIISNF